MGKVIIVLLVLFGACAMITERNRTTLNVSVEEKRALDRDAAAKAAREKLAQRVAELSVKRERILADTRAYMAKSEWRLAHQELEPWNDLTRDEPAFQELREKISTEVRAIEAKEQKIADVELRKARRREGVRVGMSTDEVLMSQWGKPERINSTVRARGTSEQWVYPGSNYLYFENGKLTSIQQSR